MSEQDKRPVFMGTFERHRKEIQVKHEDLLKRITVLEKNAKSLIITVASIMIAFSILLYGIVSALN